MPAVIIDADLSDEAQADGLLHVLASYAADPMGGGRELSADVRTHLISRLKDVETRLVLLALVEGHAAGLAIAFRGFSTFRAAPVLNLHDLAVHPDYRGQGIGRALLTELEVRARQTGCCRLTLEVRRDNVVAQALYGSTGFAAGDFPQEFWVKPLD